MTLLMEKPRKRKAGRPPLGERPKDRAVDRHVSPRECFHMSPELHAAFLDFCESASPQYDKSAVLRAALKEYLTRRGLTPPD